MYFNLIYRHKKVTEGFKIKIPSLPQQRGRNSEKLHCAVATMPKRWRLTYLPGGQDTNVCQKENKPIKTVYTLYRVSGEFPLNFQKGIVPELLTKEQEMCRTYTPPNKGLALRCSLTGSQNTSSCPSTIVLYLR